MLILLAAGGALAILVVGTFTPIHALAVGLAAGALVLGAVRATLTYWENAQMLRRSARDATLVFFDLDGFKRYNDRFGHAAGDALLSRLGATLDAAVRDGGRAYHLGGGEFCVLLEGRFTREDRLVASIATALAERGSGFAVGASYGVAVVPDDALSAGTALALADERMYADKARTSRAQARDVLMQVLSERTPGLHQHVSGVTELAAMVAAEFGLDPEQTGIVMRAAERHDVGKLAIPDRILDKPGPLDEAEWQFMRQHSVIGERILGAAPALAPVAALVRSSHERWDGGGYPDGLAGAEIPLGARIVAACDAYDAMTSERGYQRARSSDGALAELRRHAGTQFDPGVVGALGRRLGVGNTPAAGGGAPAPPVRAP